MKKPAKQKDDGEGGQENNSPSANSQAPFWGIGRSRENGQGHKRPPAEIIDKGNEKSIFGD